MRQAVFFEIVVEGRRYLDAKLVHQGKPRAWSNRRKEMPSISDAIRIALVDGQLPCAKAFAIAKQFGVEPIKVGQEADVLEMRLSKCQLGLFGYGPKAEGKHRRVKLMQNVPTELEKAIRAAVAPNGKLTCVAAWRIAKELHLPKQKVSDAAEGLGVRIAPCQLGAF
jgi:hypothetical protein